SRPPRDHAALVYQTARDFRQRAALWKDFAVHHLVQCNPESLALFDQHLNMPRNTRVHKLIADFPDIRREEFSVTRKEAWVPLVDDQVKIVDLDGVTVPVLPEQPNGFQGKLAGFEIPHERTAENFFVP